MAPKNGKKPAAKKPASKPTAKAPAKKPVVKKLASPPKPAIEPHFVQLVEGRTLLVLGKTFHRGQRVVESNPKILAELIHNNRFSCDPLPKPKPAPKAKPEGEGKGAGEGGE